MYHLVGVNRALRPTINPVCDYDLAVITCRPSRETGGDARREETDCVKGDHEIVAIEDHATFEAAATALKRLFPAPHEILPLAECRIPGLDPSAILLAFRARPSIRPTAHEVRRYTMAAAEGTDLRWMSDFELTQFGNHIHAMADHDGLDLDPVTVQLALEECRRLSD